VSSRVRPERWLVAVTEYAGLTAYTGGIGRHYAALLPALVRLGITVDLLVFSPDPPSRDGHAPPAELGGVTLIGQHRTGRLPRVVELVTRALRVRRAFQSGRYDRVFLPEWAALGSALPRTAPLLTNLATSMALANEVAGLTMRRFPLASRLVVTVQNRLERRQIIRSAGLIPISQAMLDYTVTTFGSLPPARIVRNCVDVETVAALSRTAPLPDRWPAGEDPVLLFLGRLERRKGVVDALQAFALVNRTHPRARLVLAGASGDHRVEPDRAELLSYLPESARAQVTWLGHVPGDSLYSAVRAATVTMCPSRWEGFGNVALEAKAIGAAVVCTTGSGFDDFCVDGTDALMVPPADPQRLAAAITRLLEHPELAARLGRTAAAGVARFAPGPVATDLVRAADDLLGSR
jgi:glycogen(starch) synthase